MKKMISILLALALLISCVLSVSAASVNMTESAAYDATDERCIPLDDAVKAYEKENGVKLETYRNYFYIPDGTESFFDEYESKVPTWFNEEFTDICIWYDTYNCKDAPCPESYCGFSINKTADKNIYYADIPVGVSGFLVNNGVTNTLEVYKSCNTAGFIGTGYNDAYNESYTNCDNMIYVHNIFDCYSLTHTAYFYGDWYYYYGNGCYGTVENGNKTTDCIRDDHDHTVKSVNEALLDYEAQTGETVETNRYYFLMPNGENGDQSDDKDFPEMLGKYPDSWYNEFVSGAGIYWWESEHFLPQFFPGYTMEKADDSDVYYADVPKDVKTVIFNNAIDGGISKDLPIYNMAEQTVNVPCEYYEAGESENYPNGTDSFDNMIYVIYPIQVSSGDLLSKSTWGGEWYYYYGDGCYGTVKDGNHTNCLRDDHYDDNGNHITNELIIGDVDGDGEVSIMDATEIQLIVAKLKPMVESIAVADADCDGQISVLDATAIQLKIAKLD